MLLLKLIIVPSFIGLITLAGRRWGPAMAGLLGGLPVVGGPIIFFITLEQGIPFAINTTVSALVSCVALMFFSVTYCWASIRFDWWFTYLLAVVVWVSSALLLAQIHVSLILATTLAIAALAIAPFALPKPRPVSSAKSKFNDLPIRMVAGALLTIGITYLAPFLGSDWSGLLALFPVIGSVLAVFTHSQDGSAQVSNMYRGMVKGLYSLVGYFFIFASLLDSTSLWLTCTLSALVAIAIQMSVQWQLRWLARNKPH